MGTRELVPQGGLHDPLVLYHARRPTICDNHDTLAMNSDDNFLDVINQLQDAFITCRKSMRCVSR